MKMPRLALLLIAGLIIGYVGACVSSTAPKAIVPVSTAESIAAIVEPITQGVVPLILNKNPDYAPAVSIVATAIPAAFAAGNLTAENITRAIALINDRARLNLSPDVQTLIANALSIAVTQYQQKAGLSVAAATDPGIQLILTAFATGLSNGVTTWSATHYPGSTVLPVKIYPNA